MEDNKKTMNSNVQEQAQQIQKQFEEKQAEQIQKQVQESKLQFPNKLNVVAVNIDESKQLRTSNRIVSYIFNDLTSESAHQINSFQELSKRIHNQVLDKMRRTGCINYSSVEADFVKPLNQNKCEQLDLKFKLTEDRVFSGEIGLSVDQKQRNIGLFLKPQFKNYFGQCETAAFRLRKSYLDFNKETKIFSSFSFPFITPDTYVQEYEFGMSNRNILNNLRVNRFKARSTFYSVKDPRWKFCLSSTIHNRVSYFSDDKNDSLDSIKEALEINFPRYQNLVLKASFTDKTINQKEYKTKSITQVEGQVGVGSNKSIFAKAKLYKYNQRLIPMIFCNGLAENRFSAGYILAQNNLSQFENFTLVNQPSFNNIDLNDKKVVLTSPVTFGNRYFLTNQFKYYLVNLPILSKIKIHPFLHTYAAFVPSDMNVKKSATQSQLKKIANKNLRLSAGVGLTFEINNFDRVDFIYSFASFMPKQGKDEFNKFQINFYS